MIMNIILKWLLIGRCCGIGPGAVWQEKKYIMLDMLDGENSCQSCFGFGQKHEATTEDRKPMSSACGGFFRRQKHAKTKNRRRFTSAAVEPQIYMPKHTKAYLYGFFPHSVYHYGGRRFSCYQSCR
ncbi:hypothetical protein SAMN05421740_1103 [Parapedobacter koreensis]|uniref:Uncharacterized protein n=1 Tax=Parapedobacter koreensis TaxID=332977 RepID=A0A1H7T0Q2_9SPHI|nr:hypothetical protein SAMN05421740_1103 [Parapedobacter koreensis]